jgi:hypothetical protein
MKDRKPEEEDEETEDRGSPPALEGLWPGGRMEDRK